MKIPTRLQSLFLRLPTLVGVECVYRQQQWSFNVVVLSRQKNTLRVEQAALGVSSVQNVAKYAGDNPVFLVINGQGQIHKTAPATQQIQDLLPSANPSDFYWQVQTWNQQSVWSIVRRNLIDDCLKLFIDNKLIPFDIQLGSFIISNTINLWKQSHIFNTETQQLDWDNSQFINQPAQEYRIFRLEDQQIDERTLVAFAAALQAGISSLSVQHDLATIEQQRNEFLHKQAFQKLGVGIIAFFFAALLINSMLFFDYQQKVSDLEIEWSAKSSLAATRDSLRARQQRASELWENNPNTATHTAWYADQIAATLPKQIALNQLVLFPAEEKSPTATSEQTWQTFQSNKIRIQGTCTNSIYYQQWKKRLQTLPFVQGINQLNYQDIHEDLATFSLELNL